MANANQATEFLTWDDTVIISENPLVKDGLTIENVLLALQAETLNLWHPMTLWSHQLDVSLFGLNPDLHHLSALLYHLLAGLALYFALLQLKAPPSSNSARNRSPVVSKAVALYTTLLFLLHPMHVESWAWLAERKDTLSALFAFLTLNYWARFNQAPVNSRSSKFNYALSLLFLACGLLSKPSMVVWPAVLFLTTHLQNPRPQLKEHLPTIKLLLPHLLLCVCTAVITYLLQLGRGEETLQVIATRPLHQNLVVGFNNLWIYFYKVFYPSPLSYFYEPLKTYPFTGGALGFSLFLILTHFSWKLRQSFPLLLWAWGSFVIVLGPVCGFMVSGEANAPDRYSYLAYTGPFLLLTVLASKCFQLLNLTTQKYKLILSSLAAIILISLTFLSAKRAADWKSMETLTTAAIESHPNSYAPHHHIASVYLAQNQIQKARYHIERTLALREGNRFLWSQLGIIEHQEGNSNLAQKHFLKQLVHSPNNLHAHVGLAKIYLETNDFLAALPHLEKASELVPENMAYALALKQCREAIE